MNRLLSLLVISWFAFVPSLVSAQVADWARLLPEETNSLLVVNAARIRASQLGQTQAAQEALAQFRADMPLVIPPGADLIVLASRMDVAHLTSLEQMAVLVGGSPWDLNAVAQTSGGTVDNIGGLDCVLVGSEAMVAVAPKVLAVLSPADRQSTARWVREYQANKSAAGVSDFIRAAADRSRLPDSGAITWSLELKDAFAPIAFRRAASRSVVLSKRKADTKSIADLCSGIEGVTFSIDVTDRLNGRLRFSLGQDAAPLQGMEKELAIEALTGAGCMLEEFESWTGGAQGTDVVLAGGLQEPAVRKLFHLLGVNDGQGGMQAALERPAAPPAAAAGDQKLDFSKLDADAALARNKRYVAQFNQLVKDVGQIRNADLNRQVMWVQSYANRLNSMSTRNIDPQIGELGSKISNQMLDIVAAYSNGNRRAYERQAYVVPDVKVGSVNIPNQWDRVRTPFGDYYHYAPATWMNYDLKSTVDEYRSIADEELAKANQTAAQLTEAIKQEIDQMNQRFKEVAGQSN